MIPAARLYWLLLTAAVVVPTLAAFWDEATRSPASLLGLAVFDGLMLGLAIGDGLRVRSQRVRVERHLQERLSIRRDNPVTLTVRNGGKPATLRLRDHYPLEFQVSSPVLQATVATNATVELTYTVRPAQRGQFSWDKIQVRQLGPWGLAWRSWTIAQPQRVTVYPDLVGLRLLSIRLALQSTGTMRQARRLGIGTEFAELREYRTGDDPRLIDWKATARRNRPLFRVLEPEREQTLIILLDRGRLMTARVQGLRRFDWGLNATLSLTLAALSRGDRVGIGVFDREMHTWIPPEQGQTHLSQLIERLAPIQPVLLEPDYFGASSMLVRQQTRRALVVLITDLVDATASAELLAALQRLASSRYLPFCVTLRDPTVDRLAHTLTQEITATYSRAVALDLLAQRQVAFAQLKRAGVLVLDAPADHVSEQIVDRYLQLKARGQL